MDKIILKELEIVDNLLDIVYNQDKFTTSDLQGAIQAQVHIAVNIGKNNGN
jgi:hypothetical protein